MTQFFEYEGTSASFMQAVKDSINVFLVAVVVGIVACLVFAGLAMHFIHQSQTASSVAVVEKVAQAGNPVFHFIALFINNLAACVLMLAIPYTIQRRWGKYIVFGSLISLGFLTGAVMLVVAGQHNVLFMLSSLVPHGFFELNAFFFCTSYSIMVMRQDNFYTPRPLRDLWTQAWKALMIRVIPLVLCAALVETFITPVLMSLFA